MFVLRLTEAMNVMSSMILPGFLLGLALLVGVPFVVLERTGRLAWVREISLSSYVPSAPYRTTTVHETRKLFGAPSVVKWAALSCFVFGAMIVPGLIAGGIGIVAGGYGVASLPGLVVAAMIWRVGPKLMTKAADAPKAARSAALASLTLNVPIAIGSAACGIGMFAGDRGGELFCVFVLCYALLSIGQALLLRRAATIVEDAAISASPV